MNKSELTSFGKLWGGMAEMYGKSVSDAVIAMAFAALEKYELIDIRRGINAHVADPVRGQYLAKPADLILHLDGDPESRSLKAWSVVEQSIKRVGPYQSVVFDDAAVMVALEDMGGWITLCNVSEQELAYKRAEFVKRYKGFLNRPPTSHPAKLIGLSDSHNMQHSPNYVSNPVLIGDAQRALLIMNTGGQKQGNVISLAQHLNRLAITAEAP